MSQDIPSLSIVIPVYNEEKNIPELIRRLDHVCDQNELSNTRYLFVDDGSKDESLHLLRSFSRDNERVQYMSLSRNFGHQIAVTAGLLNQDSDLVIIMDADLQDPPELIPKLLSEQEKGFDVVYAKRRKRKGESVFKTLTAKWFYRILKSITQVEIPVDTGDFRLISRRIVEGLRQMPEKHKFLRAQIAWLGFPQTYVEFDRNPRFAGETKYGFRKMLKLAIDGIAGFSAFPLKLASWLGFTVCFLSFCLLLYALYAHLILEKTMTGWTSLIVSITFIGGVQLLSLGILGEYLSRIFSNVKDRPLYLIKEKGRIN